VDYDSAVGAATGMSRSCKIADFRRLAGTVVSHLAAESKYEMALAAVSGFADIFQRSFDNNLSGKAVVLLTLESSRGKKVSARAVSDRA